MSRHFVFIAVLLKREEHTQICLGFEYMDMCFMLKLLQSTCYNIH